MPVRARGARKCAVGGSGDRLFFQAEALERRLFLSSAIAAFGTQQTFAAGASTYSVAVSDVNGDDKPDLTVVNRGSNTVSVLLGNGNGSFLPQQTFAAGPYPNSVAVSDVNGDGRPDLVIANAGSGYTVSVLLGNGNGTFQSRQTFASGGIPGSVVVSDVNGDGKPDVVVANVNLFTVSVLLGNGNGTFQTQQTFTTGFDPGSVAVTDVNGDGKPDLVVANAGTPTVSVLLGNGNGTFEAQQTFATGINPFSVAVSDVNADGRPDLVVANRYSHTVSVLLGNPGAPGASFQPQQTFAVAPFPVSVAVSDVNGDGKPDLVVANVGSNTVSVLLGNGNGTFQVQQTFATGSYPRSVAVSDVNGDGRSDLVVANRYSNTVSVLLGDVPPVVLSINRSTPPGPTTFDSSVGYTVTFNEPVIGVDLTDFSVPVSGVTYASLSEVPVTSSVYTVSIGGISGSGTLGLNLVDNGSIHDAAGNPLQPGGVASFQPQQRFAVDLIPSSMSMADVNGDGKPDLILADRSGNLGVLLGNGNGTFQQEAIFATVNNSYSVNTADLNGDGKADVIVANYGTNFVSVLLGNGNGTFQAQQTFAVGINPFFVAAADVNLDGKPDLIVANFNSDTVSVLLGNGNGTFQSQQTFAVGINPFFVAAADVNLDGKPDLIVANFNSGTVSVMLGNGNGTFQNQTTFATGSRPTSIAVSDVNGDGKPDLIVSNGPPAPGNSVSVLLGNGNGAFQNQQTFATGLDPRSVAVADLNGDGKPDLITADLHSNTVSVLLGNGNGTFQNRQTFATGSFPVALAVADVNGDGKPDLITANHNSGNVSVLLGNSNGNFTGQTYTIVPSLDTISGTAGVDQITLMQDPDNAHIDWTLNGLGPTQMAITDPNGLTINSNGSNDVITLEYTNGNPISRTLHLNGTFTINGLQVVNPLADTTLEIDRSTVLISYSAFDPLSLIQAYLANGYNNGAWNGTSTAFFGAITSIPAHNNAAQTTGIGYADSADGLIAGQPANTIELKYTVYGDTGLTTSVGFNDFTRLTQHYNQTTGGTWDTGDFNYDGSINGGDFTLMTRTYNTTLGSQAAPAAIAAASAASATATSPTTSAPTFKVARPSPQVTPPTATLIQLPQRKHKKHR